MSKFYLKVISSNRIFYEGFCTCLIIPSVDGEKAIMAHHEEVIVAVDNGEMRMQKEEGGEWNYAVLGKGFCMVANNRVTVLADTVERPEEVVPTVLKKLWSVLRSGSVKNRVFRSII